MLKAFNFINNVVDLTDGSDKITFHFSKTLSEFEINTIEGLWYSYLNPIDTTDIAVIWRD